MECGELAGFGRRSEALGKFTALQRALLYLANLYLAIEGPPDAIFKV